MLHSKLNENDSSFVESDVDAETVTSNETTADAIYKSITQIMSNDNSAGKPIPLPPEKNEPLKRAIIESEDPPSFRPDFNIDIDI